MKLLISIIFILFYSSAYASLIPGWLKSEDEEKPVVEEKKEKVCHSALNVTINDGPRVFYVYAHPCVEIRQVGIISEGESKIIHLENLKLKGGSYIYDTEESKLDYLDRNFPNISPLEFYSE